MKFTNGIVKSIIGVSLSILSCVAVLPTSAQDVPIRVTRGSATPIPYLTLYFNVDGLRLSPNELQVAPPSVSINGSRIVATVLISSDRTPPNRFNEVIFDVILPPGTYTVEVVERGATVPERRSASLSVTVPSPAETSVPAFSAIDRKIKNSFLRPEPLTWPPWWRATTSPQARNGYPWRTTFAYGRRRSHSRCPYVACLCPQRRCTSFQPTNTTIAANCAGSPDLSTRGQRFMSSHRIESLMRRSSVDRPASSSIYVQREPIRSIECLMTQRGMRLIGTALVPTSWMPLWRIPRLKAID